MALDDPLQLVMIAVVVLVILMWGPKKIPELARSIGLARKEFADASKASASTPGSSTAGAAGVVRGQVQETSLASGGDALVEAAKSLGLPTEGKTREAVSNEILQKAQASGTY